MSTVSMLRVIKSLTVKHIDPLTAEPNDLFISLPMAKKQGIVNINNKRCKVCGICVSVCPVQNYKIEQRKLKEFGKCIACLQCERYCPDMALIIDTKK